MTDAEYREMYAEYCAEGGARPTERGFAEFVSWRKKVEALFEERDGEKTQRIAKKSLDKCYCVWYYKTY